MRSEARAPVPNRGAITASIMLATFMQGVDTTIANVALPHMQGSFSVSQDQIAWVVTSYIVAAAIMTPLTGWLAGRFGIKYVFFISVTGFTVASALCGAATTVWATRRRRHPRFHPLGAERPSRSFRLLRLCHTEPRNRCPANAA